MACEPPCDLGSVTRELYLLSLLAVSFTAGGGDWATSVDARTDMRRKGVVSVVLVPVKELIGMARGQGFTKAVCMVAAPGMMAGVCGEGLLITEDLGGGHGGSELGL